MHGCLSDFTKVYSDRQVNVFHTNFATDEFEYSAFFPHLNNNDNDSNNNSNNNDHNNLTIIVVIMKLKAPVLHLSISKLHKNCNIDSGNCSKAKVDNVLYPHKRKP